MDPTRRAALCLCWLGAFAASAACGGEQGSSAATGAAHSGAGAAGAGTSAATGATSGTGGSEGGNGAGTGGSPMVPPKRTGLVQLADHSLVDDQGPFNALGATMMWAAWGYKFDRPRLEQNLDYLSKHGFHYIRALGVVGNYEEPDPWDGREIDWHWPDYDEVIAGLTDLAFDAYGLRVEWTSIGDGQINIPNLEDRYALIDRFVAMSLGREQKIMHFEVANESWQNGFGGDDGLAQLRELTAYMRGTTDILVAASAPPASDCPEIQTIYSGDIADLATVHFDRDISKVDGAWRPVRQPWDLENCEGVPVGSNNEPIGPGASVASEEDPVRLVAAAIATYVSNLPLYVFHTNAGVFGDSNLFEMPGVDRYVHLASLVPGDSASWERKNAHWPDSPLRVYAEEGGQMVPDAMWPDLAAPEAGAVRAYGAVRDQEFFVFPMGIMGHVHVEARQNMSFDVMDPMTGATLSSHTLLAGEGVDLSGGEALVVRGIFQ